MVDSKLLVDGSRVDISFGMEVSSVVVEEDEIISLDELDDIVEISTSVSERRRFHGMDANNN
jgi:hypothetical protein